MNKYTVIVEAEAEKDLKSIFKYITENFKEFETAKKLLSSISSAFDSLETFPLRHPVVLRERYGVLGLRRLIVKNYSIIYYVDENNAAVHIVNVIYNRRELNHLFNEL